MMFHDEQFLFVALGNANPSPEMVGDYPWEWWREWGSEVDDEGFLFENCKEALLR
jgi:hypothetical protein